MSIFKKKELKLYVIEYYRYGRHSTIIEATDEIDAIRNLRRNTRRQSGTEIPDIQNIVLYNPKDMVMEDDE